MKSGLRLRILLLILMFMLSIMCQGCNQIGTSTDSQINPPNNLKNVIKGVWGITKYKKDATVDLSDTSNDWEGNKAEFGDKFIAMGKYLTANPEYKVKNVNANEYFLYNYKIDASKLNLKDQRINVMTISSNSKLLYDVVIINDKRLLVYIDKEFYYLDFISASTGDGNSLVSTEKDKVEFKSIENSKRNTSSGVLIGLKATREDNETNTNIKYYRTLWISENNMQMHNVLERKDLLVPRQYGFWSMGITRNIVNSQIQESIYSVPVEINSNEMINLQKAATDKAIKGALGIKGSIRREILFVGNDYVATGYTTKPTYKSNILDKLQVLPVDKIDNASGVKISEIYGSDIKSIFNSSAKASITGAQDVNADSLEKEPNEQSFYMARKNGHWITEGRLNSTSGGEDYLDFNINVLPAKKIVNYDELSVSWSSIKANIPEAIDAFTAPNNDMALIVTKNQIYVYAIVNSKLGDKPIKKISIEEGETVVMAEWATADFVSKWEKIILDLGGKMKEN